MPFDPPSSSGGWTKELLDELQSQGRSASRTANLATWIAVGSLAIGIASLIVAIVALR
jgi:hypothetical protein